ncbi:MAG: RES family NAD+ phosphorylase [Kordiimonas sp.]
MAYPSDVAELDGKNFYRLCARQFTVFDGTGAYMYGARWTPAGTKVIYCGSSLALCSMEVLVHLNTQQITNKFHYASGKIDARYGIDLYTPERLADLGCRWNISGEYGEPQQIGRAWFEAGEHLFMVVPSVLSPEDYAVVINQEHPAFDELNLDEAQASRYNFDTRFGRGGE